MLSSVQCLSLFPGLSEMAEFLQELGSSTLGPTTLGPSTIGPSTLCLQQLNASPAKNWAQKAMNWLQWWTEVD